VCSCIVLVSYTHRSDTGILISPIRSTYCRDGEESVSTSISHGSCCSHFTFTFNASFHSLLYGVTVQSLWFVDSSADAVRDVLRDNVLGDGLLGSDNARMKHGLVLSID